MFWGDDIFQRGSEIAEGIPNIGGGDKSQYCCHNTVTRVATLDELFAASSRSEVNQNVAFKFSGTLLSRVLLVVR